MYPLLQQDARKIYAEMEYAIIFPKLRHWLVAFCAARMLRRCRSILTRLQVAELYVRSWIAKLARDHVFNSTIRLKQTVWNRASCVPFPLPRQRIIGTSSSQISHPGQYSSCRLRRSSSSGIPIGLAHRAQQHSGSQQPDSPQDPRVDHRIRSANSGFSSKVMVPNPAKKEVGKGAHRHVEVAHVLHLR